MEEIGPPRLNCTGTVFTIKHENRGNASVIYCTCTVVLLYRDDIICAKRCFLVSLASTRLTKQAGIPAVGYRRLEVGSLVHAPYPSKSPTRRKGRSCVTRSTDPIHDDPRDDANGGHDDAICDHQRLFSCNAVFTLHDHRASCLLVDLISSFLQYIKTPKLVVESNGRSNDSSNEA